MKTFINVFNGQFTDKKSGDEIKYNKVNVLDEDGAVLSLKVDAKKFANLDLTKLKMGDNVVLAYEPDQNGIARVTEINKA